MQMGFVFVLKMFQDNCNRDYFQCNRNRLHRLIVIDYIIILFIRNRNRAGGK